MPKSATILLFTTGALLLLATEILRVYLIMPFPGSQQHDTVGLAWFIDHYRLFFRAFGLTLIVLTLPRLWRKSRVWGKIALGIPIALYCVIFYFFNFRFEADKMFYQPAHKAFAGSADNKIPLDKLIIGVVAGGEAKAYPIQLIGYHHQVRDTIGSIPVMITYCTVCRTGRVYSPTVHGHLEDFRLVGMDHFNAMFEDATTKSWWQQATGAAIAGPLKDTRLAELSSEQLTLREWLEQHPDSKVLQPDTLYKKDYDDLADYDIGTVKSGLEKRDSSSWKPKSWVVGILNRKSAKAYDWNYIVAHKLIQDTIGSLPILIYHDDSADFHVWSRVVDGHTLDFQYNSAGPSVPQVINTRHVAQDINILASLQDINTRSLWSTTGLCTDGPLKGHQLAPVQSYQEFWHSWSHFHPSTTSYGR